MELKYRPEIDGLRTIAVLSVLIYHAEFTIGKIKLLQGGYLGVDVFFVISGFLITSIIMSEYHRTGSFSITNFYERRARRILPALLTVMLVSLPFAWKYLLPTQLVDFSKSVISSLLFGSNVYWYHTLQEYGAESALLKPFLHTWSLAVEEQYYIIFPLILVAIYSWSKKHTIVLLTAGFLLSLQFAESMTLRDASFSFYMLPSRFWELISGSLLANILYFHPQRNNDALLNLTMPVLGLALIVHSVIFTEFSSNHPGFVTLMPIIGTVLIIWFANENDLVTKILSSKFLVRIGLISYSLYLWHYPIFAFGRILDSTPTLASKILWFCLTLILSIITYIFIETPFRRRNIISRKVLLLLLLVGLVPIVTFSLYAIQSNGLKERFPALMKIYGQNEFDNEVLRQKSWSVLASLASNKGFSKSHAHDPSDFEKSVLWYSDDKDKTKILIIGNSHSKDLFNAVYQNKELFADKEFARFGMSAFIIEEQINELVASPNFKASSIILLSFKYTTHTVDKLSFLIRKLQEHGKKVIVASNTVEFYMGENQTLPLFDSYAQSLPTELLPDELNSLFFKNINIERSKINVEVKVIAKQMSVSFIDKYDLICNTSERKCDGITPDGYKSFFDYGHYTLEGAKYFGKQIYETAWLYPEP